MLHNQWYCLLNLALFHHHILLIWHFIVYSGSHTMASRENVQIGRWIKERKIIEWLSLTEEVQNYLIDVLLNSWPDCYALQYKMPLDIWLFSLPHTLYGNILPVNFSCLSTLCSTVGWRNGIVLLDASVNRSCEVGDQLLVSSSIFVKVNLEYYFDSWSKFTYISVFKLLFAKIIRLK